MPLVSVIIPNYNHAEFLVQRLESVLNQRFQDFEVILLDDCSTDQSREIINTYKNHPKVYKTMENPSNGGSTFLQWEKGIKAARGKYIWIAESDDYADVTLLDVLVAPLEANDEVVISYCRSVNVDENNNFLGITLHADVLDEVKWTHDYLEDASVEISKYLQYRNTIPNASAVVFRKPTNLEDVLNTDLRFCGDWLFWKNLLGARNTKIAYSSQLLNFFRTHAHTTRSSFSIVPEREIQRFREYRSFVPKFFINPFDPRFRWMMAEWIDRGMNRFPQNPWYRIFPLLHPTLMVRYYLFVVKRFFLSNKKNALC